MAQESFGTSFARGLAPGFEMGMRIKMMKEKQRRENTLASMASIAELLKQKGLSPAQRDMLFKSYSEAGASIQIPIPVLTSGELENNTDYFKTTLDKISKGRKNNVPNDQTILELNNLSQAIVQSESDPSLQKIQQGIVTETKAEVRKQAETQRSEAQAQSLLGKAIGRETIPPTTDESILRPGTEFKLGAQGKLTGEDIPEPGAPIGPSLLTGKGERLSALEPLPAKEKVAGTAKILGERPRQPQKPLVNIDLGPQETAREKAIGEAEGKLVVKRFGDFVDTNKTISSRLGNLRLAKKFLVGRGEGDEISTGSLAKMGVAFKKIGLAVLPTEFSKNFIDTGKLARQEAFISRASLEALFLRNPKSGLGLTGNTSERDLLFLQEAVFGLGRTFEGNLLIIEALEERDKHEKAKTQLAIKFYREHGKSFDGWEEARDKFEEKSPMISAKLRNKIAAATAGQPSKVELEQRRQELIRKRG